MAEQPTQLQIQRMQLLASAPVCLMVQSQRPSRAPLFLAYAPATHSPQQTVRCCTTHPRVAATSCRRLTPPTLPSSSSSSDLMAQVIGHPQWSAGSFSTSPSASEDAEPPTRDTFTKSNAAVRTALIAAFPDDRSPAGEQDPLLHVPWDEASLAAAQAGGPHSDAYGNPDPRDVATLEATLVTAGATRIAWGLFAFADDNTMHQVPSSRPVFLGLRPGPCYGSCGRHLPGLRQACYHVDKCPAGAACTACCACRACVGSSVQTPCTLVRGSGFRGFGCLLEQRRVCAACHSATRNKHT